MCFVNLIKCFGGVFNNGKGGVGLWVVLVLVFEMNEYVGYVLFIVVGVGVNGSEY